MSVIHSFSDLEFETLYDGVQAVVGYGDTYEVSIVQHGGSYGGKQGLYEIAVFENGHQKTMPGITESYDTVKGYLSKQDVSIILMKMKYITGKDGVQI